MEDIRIRPYRPGDRDAVLEIVRLSFAGVSIDANIDRIFGPLEGPPWEERKTRAVARELETYPGDVFVAEGSEGPAGFVTVDADRTALTGTIRNLAVAPGTQGRGIGKRLIARALDHMAEIGLLYARIETLDQNEKGRDLYPKFGFREAARQIHYFMPLKDRR